MTNTTTHSAQRRKWDFKFNTLPTRIKERVLSSTILKGFKSSPSAKETGTTVEIVSSSLQLPAQGERKPFPRHAPPAYTFETDPDVTFTEGEGINERLTLGMTGRTNSVYVHPLHLNRGSESLEDLFFASQESLPPFPDTVNEIVDLIRMAASLLYREMQLVLIAETQSGTFPSSRADTWSRLGQLHRLISSWPDSSFSALDGIESFKQALNDGTILCEFTNRLRTVPSSPDYGPDTSGWVSNLRTFVIDYKSFGLSNCPETLSVGNPAFDDLGIQEVADYARAIVAVQEHFGKPATSLISRPPSTRSPRDSVASFTTRLRRSAVDFSQFSASRRSSARSQSHRLEIPSLASIDEDESPVPEGGGSNEDEINPIVQSQRLLLDSTFRAPYFLSTHLSSQPQSLEPVGKLPRETQLLYQCLLRIMSNEEAYQTMLDTKGTDAQELLDFFQYLLSFSEITGTSRNDILTALVNLSTKTALYPQCFTLSFDDLETDKTPIASGHFGDIIQGKCRGQRICIKVVKLYQKFHIDAALKVFLKEAILWNQLRHPNLLPFYGVYRLDDCHGRICLVSPWMENGTVVEYLGANPFVDRRLLMRDIARGLNFLHEVKIVHGDLKGANILVTQAGRACLADFGLATLSDVEAIRFAILESSGHRGGTPRWEAPELLDDSEDVIHRTPASDIYAFGCVCYEVFTGKIPFYDVSNDFTVYIRVAKGERPSRPPSEAWPFAGGYSTDWVWAIISQCWQQNPTNRPSVSDILGSMLLSNLDDKRPEEPALFTPCGFRAALMRE